MEFGIQFFPDLGPAEKAAGEYWCGFEDASLQVNFSTLAYEKAEASMRLFAEKVMPHFSSKKSKGGKREAVPVR